MASPETIGSKVMNWRNIPPKRAHYDTQEEYDEIAASMDKAKGVAEETSSVMLDNLAGDLEELSGNFETLKLELFDTFEGTMRNGVAILYDMVNGIREATKWLTEHKGVVAAVATAIGVVTTAIVAYNVVQGVKAAMDAAHVKTLGALVAMQIKQAATAIAAVAPYIAIVAAIAAADNDFASSNMLVWFVNEQVEEEESAREMIFAAESVEGDKYGMYQLDKELATRVYKQASPLATSAE